MAAAPPAPTVDVHAHLLIPAVEQAVAEHPDLAAHQEAERRRTGAGADPAAARAFLAPIIGKLTDVRVRLRTMDDTGVDVQVVSPSPNHYHPWADPGTATTVFRTAHAAIAEHCAAAPRRLVGLGLAPLQHPHLAVEALQDALDAGLRGVEISSYAGAVELSDPGLEDFWALAADRGAVVFLHPFGCSLDQRLGDWYLANIVGQPVEHAVALSHVIFSGVLDRHPGLRLLAAHGGGYLPTHLGRADRGWRVRPESRTCAEPPSSYASKLWYDTVVHSPAVLRHLVEVVGPDRVLLGSDFPFDMGSDDPVAELAAAGFDEDTATAIRGGTAVDLFGLAAVAARPRS
ncbi:amidohydrolase family protein [Pseudonocardia sp. CA-142604]|uniref:amidohydrolase family protein n=1 Tax=Pseudonocardia sp. CA-142604 TaxID=3240024 RepID=UPI003D937B17